MKKFILTLIFTSFSYVLFSATYYWIGGTGFGSPSYWNTSANWSATSGGSGGAGVPGSSDIAVFDNNSTSYTCYLSAATDVGYINMSKGTINTNGYDLKVSYSVLSAASSNIFSGGDIQEGSAHEQLKIHANTTFSGTVFAIQVVVNADKINLHGSAFTRKVNFEQTGSSVILSKGDNTFKASCSLTNSGSGSTR